MRGKEWWCGDEGKESRIDGYGTGRPWPRWLMKSVALSLETQVSVGSSITNIVNIFPWLDCNLMLKIGLAHSFSPVRVGHTASSINQLISLRRGGRKTSNFISLVVQETDLMLKTLAQWTDVGIQNYNAFNLAWNFISPLTSITSWNLTLVHSEIIMEPTWCGDLPAGIKQFHVSFSLSK